MSKVVKFNHGTISTISSFSVPACGQAATRLRSRSISKFTCFCIIGSCAFNVCSVNPWLISFRMRAWSSGVGALIIDSACLAPERIFRKLQMTRPRPKDINPCLDMAEGDFVRSDSHDRPISSVETFHIVHNLNCK